MPYGFRSFNQAGRVIVDSNRSAYTQVMSGSLRAREGSGTPSRYGDLSIPSGYVNPVVAFQPPSGNVWALWADHRSVRVIRPWNSSDVAIPYRVFAEQRVVGPSSDRHGLRVFNSSGQVTFDSGHTTFNVISNTVASVPTLRDGGTSNTSGGAGEWIVVGASGQRAMADVGDGNTSRFMAIGFEMKSSRIEAILFPVATGPAVDGHGTVLYASRFYTIMGIRIT